MLAAPSQRWHFIAIAGVVAFFLLIFGNTFLEQPYKPNLNIPSILKSNAAPVWLIATISPAHGIQRRSIIRNTWQRLYKNDTIFTSKFVISNPGPIWQEAIMAENATFGDLIILPHLEETGAVANSIKSIEFLKYLTTQQPRKWAFVSKLDDDSFLDAHAFYEQYLHPRLAAPLPPHPDLEDPLSSPLNRTIIGRTLHRGKYSYPGGQFYTMTWDIVKLLAQLHSENTIRDEHEDVLVGRLLYEAGEKWEHVDLPNSVSFDYSDKEARGDGSAWAKPNADLEKWNHAVGPGAINPHKMRNDETYLNVAACYDELGLRLN
jgi:hypothetical protein